MKNFEKFRRINFRGKGQKTRNRESFWPRKFLTLKYRSLALSGNRPLLNQFEEIRIKKSDFML